MNPTRVLIVGLDGMTFDVMEPLAEQGVMPECAALMKGGSWGVLESTIPPVTGPAWTSFATGKQPGNHGVFDFFKPTKGNNAVGMSRRLINSREVDGKTIWQIMTEHDRTSIVMNMPVTYPPRQIKGAMITGMLTPSIDANSTWPPDLYKRLKPELGPYTITVNWQGYSDARALEFIRDLTDCQRKRTDYCLRLMDDYPEWNVCFPCYTGTDRIQHALWHYIDPKEREKTKAAGRYRQEVMDGILEYYRCVDSDIRRLREKAGADVPVFFVSDHGFGPLYGKVYVNEFLARHGFLHYDRMKLRKAMAGIFLKKAWLKTLKTLGMNGAIKRFHEREAEQRRSAEARTFYDDFYELIDWSRTKAYVASNTEGGIYINTKGRGLYGEPKDHGCVDPADYEKVRAELIDLLRTMKHPDTGQPFRLDVEPRENVYKGKYLKSAPDIVFFFDRGEWIADFGLGKGLYKHADWRTGSGMHRMEGCFLAHGPGIKAGCRVDTKIYNVAPTVLAYMGMPIPPDMDGRFIEDAFTDEWKTAHPVQYAGHSQDAEKGWGQGADVFSSEDEEVLVERLRGLGYID